MSTNKTSTGRSRLRMLKLEPRILFDGAALVEATAAVDSSDLVAPIDNSTDFAPSLADSGSTESSASASTPSLIFIDPSIEDAATISASNPGAEVIRLDSSDPWQQITDALAAHPGTSAVHLLTHGSEQGIIIGSQTYGATDIEARSTLFASWKNYLSSDADILIYGCRVGADGAATPLLASLANLTGADVSASKDDTGSADQGGNWKLEAATGPIEAKTLAFPEYRYLLAEGFSTYNWSGVDAAADPLRMITWNVIGLDSNKPETEGPNTFMVGLRVNSNSAGLSGMTIKIVDDDGIDVFGTGIIFADSTTPTTDFDDGVDNIRFINSTEYRNVSINSSTAYSDGQGGYYRDFYFNVSVQRLLSSQGQIQPFHFEVFKDANADGVSDVGTSDPLYQKLDRFSWLPDTAAANTPLYLYVEKYISQARNDVSNETYPDPSASAIRVDGYTNTSGGYDASPLTIFVGQTLSIRTEGETATQGYPQLTVSTVFDTSIFQINRSLQYYTQPITTTTYQQELGTGSYSELSYIPFDYSGTANTSDFDATVGSANTSIYANPAGWNPATHSLMITSAPPKAGGDAIVTDYSVTVSGTGSGKLSTLILDYSGSSFHYNADVNSGVEGIDFVQFQAVKGSIVGTVKADTNGDGIGDTPIQGVTVTLTGTLDLNLDGDSNDPGETAVNTLTATTDANGNYVFTDLLPGLYTVTEGVASGYGDVGDTDGSANGKNVVQVAIGKDVNIGTAAQLGLTGTSAVKEGGTSTLLAGDSLGYQRADFVEGKPDLQLTKTANTLYPEKGGNVTFTLTVSNTSSVDAPYVQVTDKLPSGLTYLSDSSGGTYNSTTGVWTLGSGVTAGSSQSITVTARLDSAAAITNFAEITAIKSSATGSSLGDQDSTAGNNAGPDNTYGTSDDGSSHSTLEDDEARVTVEAREADLSLIKTVSNSRPNVGDEVTFTLILTNTGPDAATHISVADALPAGLSYDRTSDDDVNDNINGFYLDDYTVSIGTFDGSTWNIDSLANGATATLAIRAKVTGAAALSNTAEITSVDQYDPDSTKNNHLAGEDDQSSVSITPVSADLSVAIVTSNKTPDAGQTVTYTLIVNNSGPNAASGVTVEALLPNEVTYVSDNGSGAYSPSGHLWTIPGTIAAGETKTLLITATINANSSGYLVATAEIKSSSLPDPDSSTSTSSTTDDLSDGIPDDDESSVTIAVGAADLSLLKSVSNARPSPNEVLTYTITVINSGPKDATGVSVSDLIPDGLKNVASISNSGILSNGTITWSNLSVAAGATLTLTYTAALDATGSSFTNIAQITHSDQADPDSSPSKGLTEDDNGDGNPIDDDEAILAVTPQMADIELTMSINDADGIVAKNTNFATTITVINKGPVAAYNVISAFTKDASFVFSGTPTASRGTFNTTTGIWSIGSLDVGDSVTLVFNGYHTLNNGSLTNSAQITQVQNSSSASLADVDSTPNNYATLPREDDSAAITVSTTTNSRVDLELAMGAVLSYDANSNGQLDVGDRITYTINAYNKDAADSTQPEVTIYWPSTYLTFTSSSMTFGSMTDSNATDGTLVWAPTNSGPKLGGNTTSGVTLTLVGTVTAAGAGQNIVTSAEFTNGSGSDPDSTVNNGVTSEDDYASAIVGPSRPDLELSMTASKTSPSPGDRVMFTLQVTNKGMDATNVTVAAPIPSGLTYKNFLGDGTWASNVWTIPKVGGGQTVTLYLYADVDAGATGSITNFAQITSMTVSGTVINDTTAAANPTKTDLDSTPNNNAAGTRTPYEDDEARVALNVISTQNAADLSLVKLADVTGNNTIDFKLIITNSGPQIAYDVKVTDSLPSGVTLGTIAPPAGTSYSNGVWTINSIAVGQVFILSIPVSGASGTVTNFAEITQSLASPGGVALADPDSTPDVDSDHIPDQDDEATVTVTMPSADLSLIKSVSNPNPNIVSNISDAAEIAAKSFSFSLTVINSGPDTATNVSVADILPSNFTLTGISFNTAAAGDNFSSSTWTLGTVSVGEVHILTLTGYVTSAVPFTNFAEIKTVDQSDPDSQKNNDGGNRTADQDDESLVIVTPQAADLQLSKAVDNATPSVGSNVTFTLSIVNAGPNAATNVVVTDYLPAGMTYVSNDGSATNSSGTITWNVGSVAVGEIKTLHLVATINSASAISNFAQVTAVDQYDPDSTKNNNAGHTTVAEDDEAKVTVDAREADLSLSKTVSKANPMLGDNVTFTITVSNASDDDATGVEITDRLPDGFTFVSASDSGSHTAGIGANPDTIVWSGLTVGAHASRSFTVIATAATATSLSNVAEITASDLHDPDSTPSDGTGDDYATVAVDAQQADLSLTKSVIVTDKATADVDGYFKATFTITLNNAGPDAATNVSVKDALPSGLLLLSATASAGTFDAVNGVWLLGTVASGSSPTLTIVTRVNSPAALTNTAWIATSDQPDPDSTPGNNTGTDDKSDSIADDDEASATLNVAMVDLSLDKTIDNQTPNIGDFVTYTITLTNLDGFDVATNIKVTEIIPAGLDPTTLIFTPSTGTYNSGEWTIGTLDSGSSHKATLTVKGKVIDLAALRNTAEITACDQFDIDSAPNNLATNPGEDDSATVAPGALATITGKVLDDRGGLLPDAFDANDSPISGVTIELWTDPNGDGDPRDGVLVTSTQTDASGTYRLTAPAGNYVIVETDKSGYISLRDLEAIDPLTGAVTSDTTSPKNNRIPVTMVAGGEYYDRNFLDLQPWTISGRVLSDDTSDGLLNGANETGIDGSTITLTQDTNGDGIYETTVGSVTTSGGGNYSFQAGPGRYRLVQTNKSGYVDVTDRDGTGSNTANQVDVVLQPNSANPTNRDFLDVASATTGSISGHVYLDADRDAAPIGDPQDTNLAGVTLILKNSNGNTVATTMSAADGSYSFTNVAPGTYSVVQTVPTNHSAVSDSNGGTDSTVAITLTAGSSASADFLDVQNAGTISGHVYLDADRDAAPIGDIQDSNLAGVTVILKNSNGNTVATTTSAADGSYSFTNVAPGTYSVVQTVRTNHSVVSDSDGGTDSTVAITLGAGSSASADFLDVQNAADLVTVKTLDSSDSTPAEGDTVTFLITVSNNGATQATNVSLTDRLPTGLSYTANSASQGTYDSATGIWSIGAINAGTSVTLRLSGTVNVGAGGDTITNTTTKASTPDQIDPSDSGNDLTESIVVDVNTPPPPAPLPLPIIQPTSVSVPYTAPVSLTPISTQPEMTIALHVLPAVSDAREQTNGTGSDSGQIRSTTIGAGLGMDIALHVLPAVNDVAADVRAAEKSIQSISFNSLNDQAGGSLLGYAPVRSSLSGESNDSIARTFTESQRQKSEGTRSDAGTPSDNRSTNGNQQPPITASPAESGNTDDDPSKPIARKNFSDQLRQAASQRNAQRLSRGAVAPR